MQKIQIAICNFLVSLVKTHSTTGTPGTQKRYGENLFNPATGQPMVDQFDSIGAVYGYEAP